VRAATTTTLLHPLSERRLQRLRLGLLFRCQQLEDLRVRPGTGNGHVGFHRGDLSAPLSDEPFVHRVRGHRLLKRLVRGSRAIAERLPLVAMRVRDRLDLCFLRLRDVQLAGEHRQDAHRTARSAHAPALSGAEGAAATVWSHVPAKRARVLIRILSSGIHTGADTKHQHAGRDAESQSFRCHLAISFYSHWTERR